MKADDTFTPVPPVPCCGACGSPECVQMGDRYLCCDCISVAGSCCAESCARDAWSLEEDAWADSSPEGSPVDQDSE